MKRVLVIAVTVPAVSCCPCRRTAPSVSVADSVAEHVEVRQRIDTVTVSLPEESVKALPVTDVRGDTSVLVTSAAESRVWRDDAGMVHHSLRQRAVTMKAAVAVRDTTRTVMRKTRSATAMPLRKANPCPVWLWVSALLALLLLLYLRRSI